MHFEEQGTSPNAFRRIKPTGGVPEAQPTTSQRFGVGDLASTASLQRSTGGSASPYPGPCRAAEELLSSERGAELRSASSGSLRLRVPGGQETPGQRPGEPADRRSAPQPILIERAVLPICTATRAFTLAELLVVIGIVSLLSALILPVLGKAKAAALRANCGSNLRQIGIGLSLYIDDFHKYPVFGWPKLGSNSLSEVRSRYWDFQLLPYVKGEKRAFLCPGSTGSGKNPETNWSTVELDLLWPNRSYGYNTYGALSEPLMLPDLRGTLGLSEPIWPSFSNYSPFVPEFVSEGTVLVPSQMVGIMDYDPLTVDWDGGVHPDYLFLATLTGRRHSGKATGVFCDAHAEIATPLVWTNRTFSARQRWNSDHQPHPEVWP